MVQDSPSRKLDQYIVRFPDGMRDRLKDEAAKNNRSLNAEIVARLEASFTKPQRARTRAIKVSVSEFGRIRELIRDMEQAKRSIERLGLDDRSARVAMTRKRRAIRRNTSSAPEPED